MKKIHTLFFVLLGLAVTSIGCAGGHGNLPKLVSVSPGQGLPSDTVQLELKNFNEKKDIILFGGVPVKPTMIAPDTSTPSGPASAAKSSTIVAGPASATNLPTIVSGPASATSSLNIAPSDKPLSWGVSVPGLEPGNIEITIRRGDRETAPLSFTVLGTATTGGKDEVTPGDAPATAPATDAGTGTDEVVTPSAGPTPPSAGTDTGTTTPPVEFHPYSVVSLRTGPFSAALNYVKLQWSLAYVDSAFIRVPINYADRFGVVYPDPISFGQFRGQLSNPFPFSPRANEAGLLAKLASTVMDGAFGSMPYNYCYVPHQGSTYRTNDDCYATNPNHTPFNYIDIMIPLASGQKFKSGTWKVRLVAENNVFAVYYRDWRNNLKKTSVNFRDPRP